MNDSMTRRRALQALAGVRLAWGGLRMLAGPQLSLGAQRREEKEFLYGTAFYRPPNPPRAQRREMLKAIAQDYHFNIIRIYPGWDYYNPGPDRFIFDDVDEVMSYCDEFGIKVLLGLVLESAPWWLEQAHPETRYVSARGEPRRLQGSGNNMTGGWPGLCLDWESAREAAARYTRALARFAAGHRSFYAYDCWNEPHIEPAWERNIWAIPQEKLFCYCDRTIETFHQWLEQRYGTIDRLNEAWTRRYPNWKAIDPPRALGTYADWVDWRRFIIERSTRELHWRVDTLRSADPGHVFEDHAAHHPPLDAVAVNGVNLWRLAEQVDTWGLSLFPRWFSFPVYLGAARFDITRSCAAGKDFWLTELQGGHGNSGLWRSHKMRARDIRLWNWVAVAAGARGIVYWTYHAEGTGNEASGFGLVDRSGAPTERVEEAALNRRLIHEHRDVLRDYRPKPEVAVLFDQDNPLLTYAMSGDESASTDSACGYAKALWNLDLFADFIEPAGLESGKYRVVLAPWHIVGKKDTCDRLRRFVEAGGTLIVETSLGLFDERFFFNPVIPPHGLSDAFGYREKEAFYISKDRDSKTNNVYKIPAAPDDVPPSDRIYFDPQIEFSEPAGIHIKGHTFVTPIAISSAKAIAKCGDFPVAAAKRLGKGQVYYIGTNLGASIYDGDDGGIELLRRLITPVITAPVRGGKLRPRLIDGPRKSLLAIFNDTPHDQSERIELPRAYASARDIHSGSALALERNAVQVTVPYENAVVLLLEHG